MNNFIFDEMQAEEYRYERKAEAKEYNAYARFRKKKSALRKLGALLERWGVGIQDRYDNMELPEEQRMLAKSTK